MSGSICVAEVGVEALSPCSPQLCGDCWEMLLSTNTFALHLLFLVAAKVPYIFTSFSQIDTDVV